MPGWAAPPAAEPAAANPARGGEVEATADAAEPPVPTPRSPEEAEAAWHDALDAHDRAGRDASWAPNAESLYQASFAEIESDTLRFDRVDCRASTCVAHLTYASFRDALDSVNTLISHNFGMGCGIRIGMPEPDAPDEDYPTHVLFDC